MSMHPDVRELIKQKYNKKRDEGIEPKQAMKEMSKETLDVCSDAEELRLREKA